MNMLQKFLTLSNRMWSANAKFTEVVEIRPGESGEGANRYVTIENGKLFLASIPYRIENMSFGSDDSVLTYTLDGKTLNEVITEVVTDTGIDISWVGGTQSVFGDESAILLMDVRNMYIGGTSPIVLLAIDSNLPRFLYPFQRALTMLDIHTNLALEQIPITTARGSWLDYWVSYFKLRRLPDETDELLLRRALITITSAKSNNIAMEEIVSFYINAVVKVLDNAPSELEVRVSPQYMNSANKVREIIDLLKSGGVSYFLNYATGVISESYREGFRSLRGDTFGTINRSPMTGHVELQRYEEDYKTLPEELQRSFINNYSYFNSNDHLSQHTVRVRESVQMVMTDSQGNIVQQT